MEVIRKYEMRAYNSNWGVGVGGETNQSVLC